MAIKFNTMAYDNAKKLIQGKLEVAKHHSNWAEDKPTPDEVSKYLNTHDIVQNYGLWFLGLNMDIPKDAKEHYVYPTGDLKIVHRSALVESEKQAKQKGHTEIAQAARKLIDLIDSTIK